MPTITLNGEPRPFNESLTVLDLLRTLGYENGRVAVELNCDVVPKAQHENTRLNDGDAVEIVTLVGGGSADAPPADKPLKIGKFTFRSRLFTGTGKYATFDLMRDCLAASGCEVTTVAVRRERLVDAQGRNLLDYLDLKQLHDSAEHGGLLLRRRCDSPCPARPRTARQPRQSRCGLGEARMSGRQARRCCPTRSTRSRATEKLVKEGFTGARVHDPTIRSWRNG